MKQRKLKRGKRGKKGITNQNENIILTKADKTAASALAGEASIDCVGNFIFFSTESGYAWLLDHRRGAALRLADNFHKLPHSIRESKERFQIQWKERYRTEGETFIAISQNQETAFHDCPVDAIEGLIRMLKSKAQQQGSPAFSRE